ncbi:hypothetical protein [Agrobacterium pusense]|uniref:hypothetical protein n=1 Tax=Agrobacterium pusense TaxID=648995 RepID=UPI0013006813|nr:hypothetical protein [Agrobacterium pusense]
MIRHAWAVDISDSSLKAREWAGVRPSTTAERRLVSAGRRDICCTFAFRQCQRVLRLVVSQEGVKQPFFSTKRKFEKAIDAMVSEGRIRVDEPYSTTVLAVAATAVPSARADIERIRDTMQCADCSCVLKDEGPVDPKSDQYAFVVGQLVQSKFGKGVAL